MSGSCQLYQTGGLWLSSDTAPQTTTHLKLSTQSQRLLLQDERIPAGSIKKQQLFQSRKETNEKKMILCKDLLTCHSKKINENSMLGIVNSHNEL